MQPLVPSPPGSVFHGFFPVSPSLRGLCPLKDNGRGLSESGRKGDGRKEVGGVQGGETGWGVIYKRRINK